jgi:HAD superfamily hydrolase (TIGR01549 family)
VASSPIARSSRPLPLRAVLFDADHTLLDTGRAERSALRTGLAAIGVRCPERVVTVYRDINVALWALYRQGAIDQPTLAVERFRRLLAVLGRDAAQAEELGGAYLEAFSQRGDLFPACRETLRRLGRRYRLAVVTNGIDRVQRRRLQAAGLDAAFEVIVTSGGCGYVKPDPRIMHVALGALGVSADEALYVGDDDGTDGAAARGAGMQFWLMQHGAPAAADGELGRANSLRDFSSRLLASAQPVAGPRALD